MQGWGHRSNGPELSPFRLRTSEVPALHLFYPSSLIRPGWPRDPGARVTCQLTVYSWARGLTLCQHLFCEKGGSKKRGVCVSVVKTLNIYHTISYTIHSISLVCYHSKVHISGRAGPRLVNFLLRWHASVIIPVYSETKIQRNSVNRCLHGYQLKGVPKKTLQKPPFVCCQLSIRVP